MSYRVRKDCRLCESDRLVEVLHLAPTPPANEFVAESDPAQETFPLYLVQCEECGHVQLPVVVDPARLFGNYVYVSGTSPSFVDHFRRYAESLQAGLRFNDLVVDIGSNDGTLLKQFASYNMRVLGVDPAKNIAARATADGIETWTEFFAASTGARIAAEHGPAALVVANNVFAHADDLRDIAIGVRNVLDKARGRFVFEVQYLVDLVNGTLFDMIYHEHLSYHSLAPLLRFFDSLDMTLVDAERVPTHGGSIRCTVVPHAGAPASARLQSLLVDEAKALDGNPWAAMRTRIDENKALMRAWLNEHAHEKVAGYGAPAKLTTLCHEFGIEGWEVSYVVDDSVHKRWLRTPGTRMRVVPPSRLQEDPPQYVIVFAWNFAEQIAKKLRDGGYTGKIVVPLPTFREIA